MAKQAMFFIRLSNITFQTTQTEASVCLKKVKSFNIFLLCTSKVAEKPAENLRKSYVPGVKEYLVNSNWNKFSMLNYRLYLK